MADVYFPHFGALGAVTAGTVIHNTVGARTYRLRTGSGGRGKTNLSKRRAGIREKILYMNEWKGLPWTNRRDTKQKAQTQTQKEKKVHPRRRMKKRDTYIARCAALKKKAKVFFG